MEEQVISFIMAFAGSYDDYIILSFIDDSIFIINTSTPPARQISFQGFGFSYPIETISLNIF